MTEAKKVLEKIKLFVLDMDGTFYLGDQEIDGAVAFTEKVRECGKEFLFFTNNSSKTGEMYMDKLAKMGRPITKKDIMTSGDVTIAYLKTHYPDKTIFLAGVPELEAEFHNAGLHLVDDNADIVVVAFDKDPPGHQLSCGRHGIHPGLRIDVRGDFPLHRQAAQISGQAL